MITVGNIKLKNNIFLAPMAGVSDLAFRLVCKKWGAGLVFSEMVSAKALHYNDKKTLELLKTHPDESPLGVQIFGSDPCIMAESAKKIQDMGFSLLDINFGCPAPKIVKSGDGSALLCNPKLMGEITSAVTRAVSIPVMCKIRSGYDEFTDVAHVSRILEQSGAAAITVHGRTRKMFYSGLADRTKVADAKNAVSIYPEEDVNVFLKKNEEFVYSTGFEVYDLKAPINRGDVVGKMFVFDKNNMVVNEVNLIAGDSAKEIGFKELFGKIVTSW